MSCRCNTVLRVLRISKNGLSYILLSQSVALDGPIESLCAELLTFWFVDHHKKGFSPDPTPMGFRNWYYTCMGREYNNVKQLSQPIPVTRVVDWQCTNVKSSQKKKEKCQDLSQPGGNAFLAHLSVLGGADIPATVKNIKQDQLTFTDIPAR